MFLRILNTVKTCLYVSSNIGLSKISGLFVKGEAMPVSVKEAGSKFTNVCIRQSLYNCLCLQANSLKNGHV